MARTYAIDVLLHNYDRHFAAAPALEMSTDPIHGDRSHAVFDDVTHGANLYFDQGNTVVANGAPSSAPAVARATQSISSGLHYCEFVFWGEGDLTDAIHRVGLLADGDSLNAALGSTANSYGLNLLDGELFKNGAFLVDTVPVLKKTVVGMKADFSASQLVFYINNISQATVALSAGAYFPAVSVGNAVDAFEIQAFINCGQRAFEYDVAGQQSGVFTEAAPPPLLRIADGDWLSAGDDMPANTAYYNALSRRNQITFTRSVHFWPWARKNKPGSQAFGSLVIDNQSRIFDFMLSAGYRDQFVAIRARRDGVSLANSALLGVALAGKVKATAGDEIHIDLADTWQAFDKPLVKQLFLPSVDESAANRPLPVSLGAVRNIEPILYDEVNRHFRVAHAAVTSIAVVKDKADPLDPTAMIPDWVGHNPLTGFTTEVLPTGKITADISSTMFASVPTADALRIGAPFIWRNGVLLGWDYVNNSTDFAVNIGSPRGINIVRGAAAGGAAAVMCRANDKLEIGKTYRYRITASMPVAVACIVQQTDNTTTATIASFSTSNIYRGTFVASYPHIQIGFAAGAASTLAANIDELWVQDAVYEDPTLLPPNQYELEGITLEAYMQTVIEALGGFATDDWSAADVAAIQAGSNYRMGFHSGEPATVAEAIDAPLDSFGVGRYTDKFGRVRFTQLRDPDIAGDNEIVLEINANNLRSKVFPEADEAPGLTTRIGVRKNWSRFSDADFVDDFVDVPAVTRRQYRQEAQLIRVASNPLASVYKRAQLSDPLISLLEDPRDGDTEIARICKLFEVPRGFFPNVVVAVDAGTAINPGDIVRLTYPGWGLRGGRKLLVKEVADFPQNNRISLILWGSL